MDISSLHRLRADIALNLAVLREFEHRVDVLIEQAQWEAALAMAQTAMDFAWYNTTGVLVSDSIERNLSRCAKETLPVLPIRETQTKTGRVLHVMSEAHHSAGGHVRMAWRWIKRDSSHTHDVLITNQPAHEGPSYVLTDAVVGSGGSIRVLNHETTGFIERALAIRSALHSYDFIIINIHPYDALAFAALCTENSPPRIFFNHADHVAWLGAGIADVVANWRPTGARLCAERRGISSDRSVYLPLAIENSDVSTRDEVRAELNLADNATVMITTASAYKYETVESLSFLDFMEQVLNSRDNVILLALGGGERHDWHQLSAKMGGRLRVMGVTSDVGRYLAASDIYLDSFPVSSATSIMEGAAHGLACLSLEKEDASDILSMRDWEKYGLMKVVNAKNYVAALLELIDYPQLREQIGQEGFSYLKETSLSPTWERHLENLYQVASNTPKASTSFQACAPRCETPEFETLQVHQEGGMTKDASAFARHLEISDRSVALATIELMTASSGETIVLLPTSSHNCLMECLSSVANEFGDDNFNVVLLHERGDVTYDVARYLEGDFVVLDLDTFLAATVAEIAVRSQASFVHVLSPTNPIDIQQVAAARKRIAYDNFLDAVYVASTEWLIARRHALEKLDVGGSNLTTVRELSNSLTGNCEIVEH